MFSGLWSKGSRKCWSSVFPTELERHTCIILSHILPGTTIYSDQFTLYIPLNQLGYIHLLMNHSKNFVEPDSGAHTNTIKGVWALIKKKLRCMCGTLYRYILSYLDEFTWFRNFGRQLLEDITKQFPVQ